MIAKCLLPPALVWPDVRAGRECGKARRRQAGDRLDEGRGHGAREAVLVEALAEETEPEDGPALAVEVPLGPGLIRVGPQPRRLVPDRSPVRLERGDERRSE